MRTREKYLTDYRTSEHLFVKERKKAGSFYTPPHIALKMAKETNWKNGTVIDPAVGSGNLLAAMMDTYPELQEENLYGVDIDPQAIEICRKLFPYGNFVVGDSLKDDLSNEEFWGKNA